MQDEVIYLEANNTRRRYVLHRSQNNSTERPHPVVIMLAGRGGTPWTAIKTSGWSAFADERNLLVAYPEATRIDESRPLHFLENPQMWNAGIGGSDTDRAPVDDVAFLNAVIDDLLEEQGADPNRVYMTGFSNGASMTFRFAVESGERLAAMGTVSGHYRAGSGAPTQPVPLAHFFGKLDPLNPYDGGLIDLPWGKTEWRPSARDSVVAWAKQLDWPEDASKVEKQDGVTFEQWGEPGDSREIIFTTIHDLGHVWPGGKRLLPENIVGNGSSRLSATAELWRFFQRHTR